MPDLRVTEPLGYLEFLNLMANARLMLTDSGGIQEETTILGVPFDYAQDSPLAGLPRAKLRENIERPVEWNKPVDALWTSLDAQGRDGLT